MARSIKDPIAVLFCAFSVAATAQDAANPPRAPEGEAAQARALVERADEIRFPKDSYQVDVVVHSTRAGAKQEPRRYRVLSKDVANSIVMTLEPEAERGQNMLLKGRDLWVFMPNVSQPVRLSLSQRLIGEVANGDLARANFSGDYAAAVIGTERIGGKEHQVLELSAVERGVTYARIKYWVRSADQFPYKAEFYSSSGRLLKTCHYEQFQTLGGRVRPTRLVIVDALKSDDQSVLEYTAMRSVNLPDKYFTKEYLKKLD